MRKGTINAQTINCYDMMCMDCDASIEVITTAPRGSIKVRCSKCMSK